MQNEQKNEQKSILIYYEGETEPGAAMAFS